VSTVDAAGLLEKVFDSWQLGIIMHIRPLWQEGKGGEGGTVEFGQVLATRLMQLPTTNDWQQATGNMQLAAVSVRLGLVRFGLFDLICVTCGSCRAAHY